MGWKNLSGLVSLPRVRIGAFRQDGTAEQSLHSVRKSRGLFEGQLQIYTRILQRRHVVSDC